MRTQHIAAKEFKEINLNGQDVRAELAGFASWVGLSEAIPGRYSILLVLDLLRGFALRQLSPIKIMDEIKTLEGVGARSALKPAAPFLDPPLRGLWHKHYLQDGLRSMAVNLKRGIERDGVPLVEQWAREAAERGEARPLTEHDLGAIAMDAVIGNWERLNQSSQLTGEWIIFVPFRGSNYYLCLGNHDRRGHPNLRRHIDSVACAEFLFLSEFLTNA